MTALRAVQRQIRTLLTYAVYRNVECSSLNARPLKQRSDLLSRLLAEAEVLAIKMLDIFRCCFRQ